MTTKTYTTAPSVISVTDEIIRQLVESGHTNVHKIYLPDEEGVELIHPVPQTHSPRGTGCGGTGKSGLSFKHFGSRERSQVMISTNRHGFSIKPMEQEEVDFHVDFLKTIPEDAEGIVPIRRVFRKPVEVDNETKAGLAAYLESRKSPGLERSPEASRFITLANFSGLFAYSDETRLYGIDVFTFKNGDMARIGPGGTIECLKKASSARMQTADPNIAILYLLGSQSEGS